MLAVVLLTLVTSQAQPEVRVLPIHAGRTTALELVAASDRFVWVRVTSESQPLAGGAGLYRIDLQDGGLRTAAAFAELTPLVSSRVIPRPQPWGATDLLAADGLVSEGRARRFGAGRVEVATNRVALVPRNSETLLWRPGRDPLPLPYDTASKQKVALLDGRVASEAQLDGGSSGLLVVSAEGEPSFRPGLGLGGRLGAALVLEDEAGVFTEAGLRLGDFSVFQGDEVGQSRILVGTRDGGLWVTDGTPSGALRLRTTGREVQVGRTVVGAELVAFRRSDGGLLVERLADGARFDNPTAPDEGFTFDVGRVVMRRSGLVVLPDGGLERPSPASGCVWQRLRENHPDAFCLHEGTLLRRAQPDAGAQVLVADLTVAAPPFAWTASRRSNLDRGLFFSEATSSHWTDGVDSYSLEGGERLLQEVGNRLLVARDGHTLIDPKTNQRTAFGLPLAVTPLRAARGLFFQFPGCGLQWLSPRGTLERVWADRCVDEVAETPGGTLLLTQAGHGWFDAPRGLVLPIETGTPVEPRTGPRKALAIFGDVVWATTPGQTTVPIDATTGRASAGLPVDNLTFTDVGAIGPVPEWTWFSLDGGRWAYPPRTRLPFLAVASEAAWLVGDVAVYVATGGAPVLLDGVDAGAWRPGGRAVGRTLVRPGARGLTVLEIDGSERHLDLQVFDPDFPIVLGERLWFAAFDEEHGVEPWTFDGTEARLVADLVPGPDSSYPRFVGAVPRGVVAQAGRVDGTIGAVALLLEPESASVPETRSFSGGGCVVVPLPSLLAVGLLLSRRRCRGGPSATQGRCGRRAS